jgi:DNA-binding MarR family transcriptional regulator
MTDDSKLNNDSISGLSAEFLIGKDESLASLLRNHGIKVRDFILLSFLSDQGPMSVTRLARIVGLEPEITLQGLKRLSAANLVQWDPAASNDVLDSTARLTGRGQEIAARIGNQIE